jgi:hypothetical protein
MGKETFPNPGGTVGVAGVCEVTGETAETRQIRKMKTNLKGNIAAFPVRGNILSILASFLA